MIFAEKRSKRPQARGNDQNGASARKLQKVANVAKHPRGERLKLSNSREANANIQNCSSRSRTSEQMRELSNGHKREETFRDVASERKL